MAPKATLRLACTVSAGYASASNSVAMPPNPSQHPESGLTHGPLPCFRLFTAALGGCLNLHTSPEPARSCPASRCSWLLGQLQRLTVPPHTHTQLLTLLLPSASVPGLSYPSSLANSHSFLESSSASPLPPRSSQSYQLGLRPVL